MSTLHWKDEQAEIHKVVVGPMDNNVFVLRCTQTGEALLVDACDEGSDGVAEEFAAGDAIGARHFGRIGRQGHARGPYDDRRDQVA